MASVSDFIELAPNENIVKEYRSFRMKKPQNAIVNIAATNMRLILYGQSSRGRKSGRPTLTQEIRIEDIRGVEIYEKERPNIILAVFGLFFLASAALLTTDHLPSVYRILENILGDGSYGTLIAGVLGIILFASAFLFRNREFDILVKGNSSNLNTGMFSEKTVFKEGIDSPRILRELGSIIIQIQKEREKPKQNSTARQEQRSPLFNERPRKEFSVEDLTEERERESIFEDDYIPETRPRPKHEPEPVTEPIPEQEAEEESVEFAGEENSEPEKTEEEDGKKDEEIKEDIQKTDKSSGKEIIEEYYDRRREKINVDDILETMQMIDNPTSKKKGDDYLF